ncbi:MAG: non-canonical purine NTP pyrophosphatase, RdgB/HAM1 family [Candidatus Methanomethylicota archaeon]|uniref:dITP/XTP pyrophosphatase n=1 Tax=Thermoproteota archaeon TaxID=2056631 RepID=A0A497ET94_9CREN|nr:MAG: non-canonical purine NTP pyrophosphatase, RdgB/HAM1 family [Candidatus Verstraetearchaeota archaeon]RLE53148.1 MAG: non-canonical purine NTP pyrophosphatase, RdgB/HAM1 family [Candidatus Verstraetearchaeota archaeon]
MAKLHTNHTNSELYFVTENTGKFREAYEVLSKYGITLRQLSVKRIEIQSENLEEIAKFSAQQLIKQYNLELIVEDAGLFIEALNGFPGPFSSYVYKTIGVAGILKLMEGKTNRAAQFKSVVCYCSPKSKPAIFTGIVKGAISKEPRGLRGFGFDPIFIPEGSDKTFAEMSVEEKNSFSHRAKAFKAFTEYYLKQILKSR